MNKKELYDVRIKADSVYLGEIVNELLDAKQSVWIKKIKDYFYIKAYTEQYEEQSRTQT